ncbi:peptidylprolyl isomerase [Pseudooceanicola sp. 502str34]|jgi:peptidyl-prolyl cis-trans isomerase C
MSRHTGILAALCLSLPMTAVAQDATPTTEAPAAEATSETPAKAATADTVVATVNGVDITLGHMILVRAGLPAQYAQLPNDALFEGILQQLIQQTALSQGVDEVPHRVELAMENEKRALMAGEAVTAYMETAITDDALQAAYEAQYGDAEPGTEYHAAHILVETEDEAKAIKEELDGGADFAALARDKSTGPSGPTGGDLGWFSDGMMVKPFEDAVKGMEPGAVSDPVQTQFGWHVIKLEETRDKAAPTLDEVRDELTAQLQEEAVSAHIEEVTAAATIDRSGVEGIDPNTIADFGLLE